MVRAGRLRCVTATNSLLMRTVRAICISRPDHIVPGVIRRSAARRSTAVRECRNCCPEASLCVTGNRLDYHQCLFSPMATRRSKADRIIQCTGAVSAVRQNATKTSQTEMQHALTAR